MLIQKGFGFIVISRAQAITTVLTTGMHLSSEEGGGLPFSYLLYGKQLHAP